MSIEKSNYGFLYTIGTQKWEYAVNTYAKYTGINNRTFTTLL